MLLAGVAGQAAEPAGGGGALVDQDAAQVDLLGRTVAYTDVKGTTTTTVYDPAGRPSQQVTTPAAGGPSSTVATTYLADGRAATVSVDGTVVAQPSYDAAGELNSVTYPTLAGTAAAFTKDAQGRQVGISYALPSSRTLTDTVTRSQAGRVMTDTATLDAATVSGWAYAYDSTGRLTQATLAANGTTPAIAYGYSYTATGGCGPDPRAGMDGARSSSSVQVGTASATVTTFCTDYDSRLVSTSTNGAVNYNVHGDATSIDGQDLTYDASDRATAGTGAEGSPTITYSLDANGRIVTRLATGTGVAADTTSTGYSYAGGGDAPDVQLAGDGTIGERYIALPGGVLYTKRYGNPGGASGRSRISTGTHLQPLTSQGLSVHQSRSTTPTVQQ